MKLTGPYICIQFPSNGKPEVLTDMDRPTLLSACAALMADLAQEYTLAPPPIRREHMIPVKQISGSSGPKIRAARERAGLTQAELAAELGISYQNVAQWEGCHREPKLSSLRRIARILDTSWLELLPEEALEELNPDTNFEQED